MATGFPSRDAHEARAFQRHAVLFAEKEEDCGFILAKISDNKLMEDGTLKSIERSIDKISKNRYVATECVYIAYRSSVRHSPLLLKSTR